MSKKKFDVWADRSPIFMCGSAGGIVIPDEHSEAGHRYADERNEQHFREHGVYTTLEQQVEWAREGQEASRRRMSIRESEAVNSAIELLKRHGYKVKAPNWEAP